MKKVYIVDDDRNIVESLTMVLEKEGFNVKSQYDECDVVKKLTEFEADLVILDVMFPEDESAGFGIAREIKQNDRTKNIPILMLSAINEKAAASATFSNKDRDDSWLPVEDFVEKPINPKDLVAKVRALTATKIRNIASHPTKEMQPSL